MEEDIPPRFEDVAPHTAETLKLVANGKHPTIRSMYGSAAGWKITSKPTSAATTPGRNDPCPCGSGVKFKKCCG